MNRLRNRLILVYVAATAPPLALTLWLSKTFLSHSLEYAQTRELDEISRSLETTGRVFYQREREQLRQEASSGRLPDVHKSWSSETAEFLSSGQPEQFLLAGRDGGRLLYLVRRDKRAASVYERDLGGVALSRVREQYARAREMVDRARNRDLERGFLLALLLFAGIPWLAGFTVLLLAAHRISRPVQQLTEGLKGVAAGHLSTRVAGRRDDEVGAAIEAFNRMAEELERSRDRLLFLTRMESWQALARKMAHELKNSLTPIRLTTEEMAARQDGGDSKFQQQAAQIIADEVAGLERRVRAFRDFAAEPPVALAGLDLNALVADRLALLRPAHPGVDYRTRIEPSIPRAWGDEDLVKVALTNLLENAAQAAGEGGAVLTVTRCVDEKPAIEVHDSGPGLTQQAMSTLFEPTISFK
ncbi:MAG: sensor histidine kinase, partial [Bryobacteraceae bacterium]